jgi:putative copper resistance protein D
VLLLFGGFTFATWVVRSGLRESGGSSEHDGGDQRLLRVAATLVLLALGSAVLWLALAAAEMSGLPWQQAWGFDILRSVLGGTWFGRVWIVRFGLALALGVVIVWASHQVGNRNHARALALCGLFAALLLATLALTGHAAAFGGGPTPVVAVVADALHALAAGAWIGALPPFLLLLSRTERAAVTLSTAGAAARRMSALGMLSVACLIVTGLLSTAYQVGGVPELLGTTYGRLLAVKLGLFALMLGFAAANRRRWTPMLAAANATAGSVGAPAALQRLKRNAICEILLAFAIVLLVAALGTVAPGAHEPVTWPLPFTATWPDEGERTVAQWVLGAAGIVAGAVLILVLRARGVGSMRAGTVGLGVALASAVPLCVVPAYPTTYLQSPIRYTATSIARGSVLYTQHCATCHGAHGYGDGPAAAGLPAGPLPLTTRLLSRREGDLFWLLANGVAGTAMPAFSAKLAESERWDIINFLLAQADAEAAKTMNGSVEPWRGTLAPDFTFEAERGAQETLNEQRRRSHVLLVLFGHPESMSRLCILAAAEDKLARGGVRLLAVPMNRSALMDAGHGADSRCMRPAIAAGPDSDIVTAYTLFRRIPPLDVPPIPAHSEFLIDRQGYLRARWFPHGDYVWDGLDDLLRQAAKIDRQQSRPDAPERPGERSQLLH